MLRWFVCATLISGLLWAKNPYLIAVCGMSRSGEQIELALELIDDVLVKKCGDRKLDASIKMQANSIEAHGPRGLILSQKRSDQVLGEPQVNKFIVALLKRLAEPKPKAKIEEPKIEKPKEEEIVVHSLELRHSEETESTTESRDPGLLRDARNDAQSWQIESLASIDQWNYQISTKVYPGVQLGARVNVEQWEITTKAAFGTSAFQVDNQIAWNQQVFANLSGGRKFELGHGFSVMPKGGYLFWGSFSGLQALPSFQHHDLDLGADLIFNLEDPNIEMRLLFSMLPINLGLQSGLTARYYFVPNWFASLQGGAVALWASEPAATFFSGSLGLGVVL